MRHQKINQNGYLITAIILFFVLILSNSCKKMVEIDPPVNSITSNQVFNNDANATAAVNAIYTKLINTDGTPLFGSGALTVFCGLSSDELNYFFTSGAVYQFNSNSLLPNNTVLSNQMWGPAYFAIYQASAAIEGLQPSNGVTSTLKNQLIGECKFIRAFCYFYLVNLFGDVPLVTTSDWNKTYLKSRSSVSDIYKQIVNDLEEAKTLMSADYSFSKNERARPNKWAATALLARVYLYNSEWTKAEEQSNNVISNSTLYSLTNNLNNVFLRNSSEAIWQLQPSKDDYPFAIAEANFIIQNAPVYYLTDNLYSAFEAGDQRKAKWLASVFDGGKLYYYPHKYKVDEGSAGSTPMEYYTLLRLGEQYLIRAEARSHNNNLTGAISDINVIRSRAGLTNLSSSLSQTQVFSAIEQERRVELFSELGHRWFDLKRTSKANSILAPLKGSAWQSTDQLYPIPLGEMQKDPNLSQNDGY